MMAYAHTPNDKGEWHELSAHLRGTADLAQEFATTFGGGDLAYYIGMWHDLGKFNPKFQEYLALCHQYRNQPEQAPKRGPDHKAAGTQLAMQHLGPLALLVQGHHGGLHSRANLKAWLKETYNASAVAALATANATIPDLVPAQRPTIPTYLVADKLASEMYLRFIFSCLTDADFLDTERHFNATRAAQRGSSVTMTELWQRLAGAQDDLKVRRQVELQSAATPHQDSVQLNQARDEIYHACIAAAEGEQGFFRLTVPTGGGKTRSAMAFALNHAIKHKLRRVIVAVPFTTITEQTAEVYRSIFARSDDEDSDAPVVLEHHSAADNQREDEEGEFGAKSEWARLAAENWDAPIVVTTTVQLFESLFANRTSRCRKLHRLAGSVIILDEAQALPSHLLTPILSGLRELCAHYGATVVISTATQPAFDTIAEFKQLNAREIVPAPARYFDLLQRVRYDWQVAERKGWDEVAELMRAQTQALVIVNTKKHAQSLFDALEAEEGTLHLSTLLCAAHRRRVVAEVRQRLKNGQPCRLVSTQVVEAGVDLDFPLVLRAVGPMDSIVQAAGRCNREGTMMELGQVIIFRPEDDKMPPGAYYKAAKITDILCELGEHDLNKPDTWHKYFKMLFETVPLDRGIQPLREEFDYPEVAKQFRMIDDDTEVVVITDYGSDVERGMVAGLLKALRAGSPKARGILRLLQPYSVAVRRREAEVFKVKLLIEEIMPSVGVWKGGYDARRGLTVPAGYNTETLVV